MQLKNEYLAVKPFDLYELHLIELVAVSGSFTRAAVQAGLTQSAVTRQIKGVEDRLGIRLFERTTRRVLLSEAGQFLLKESRAITGDLDSLIQRLKQDYGGEPREVRIGLSRSIGLACYPGFLFANRRKYPDLTTRIWQDFSDSLLRQLEDGSLDIAVVSRQARMPSFVRSVHRFKDDFVLIAPASEARSSSRRESLASFLPWAKKQHWILIHENTTTGSQLRQWMKRLRIEAPVAMQADNFDLIINLVSLGYGVSFVPHRALALYTKKRNLCRIRLTERFSRELAVLVRRRPAIAPHVADFVGGILF